MNTPTSKLIAFLLALPLAMAGFGASASAAPPAHVVQGQWQRLDRLAAGDGVPVIVELNVKTRPEHTLDAHQRNSQRKAVRQTADNLIKELRQTAPRDLKTSETMPLVAFTATSADLKALRGSHKATAVVEDEAHVLSAVNGDSGSGEAVGTPASATPVVGGGTSATRPNGTYNQLKPWWHYNRQGIHRANNNGWNGRGQTVAIFDTGVESSHPWLQGRVVNEACFSRAGHCPNGLTSQLGAGAAAPCRFHSLCAHGTHVAHSAAGYWGAAPGATIIAVQIFSRGSSGKPTYYNSDLVWALNHIYSIRSYYNIAAINMSITGARYKGYCNSDTDNTVAAGYVSGWIKQLRGAGIASVVSTGNDNDPRRVSAPACMSPSIGVGNSTITKKGKDAVYGRVSGGSNAARKTLKLLAPGTDICSAVPTWLDNDGKQDGVNCSYIGTSMAAPQVTGAMAVLRQYRPGASVATMVQALKASGPKVRDSRNGLRRTRINVWRALGAM